jgi:thiol:disulfide interchange protein DsbD
MKKIILLLVLVCCQIHYNFAQVVNPVKWSLTTSKKKISVGDEIDLLFECKIEAGWYCYAKVEKPGEGPNPIVIDIQKNNSFSLVGNIILPDNVTEKIDNIFEMKVWTFKKQGIFKQKIKILKPNPTIDIIAESSSCNEITNVCLPPKKENLTITIQTSEKKGKTEEKNEKDGENKSDEPKSKDTTQKHEAGNQNDVPKDNQLDKNPTAQTSKKQNIATKNNEMAKMGWVSFIVSSFLAGFAAFLMPCIFPLLPTTITFFVKMPRKKEKEIQSEQEKLALKKYYHRQGIKKAIFYGLSIIGIFTIVGTAAAAINGPAFANWLSTHWIPNLFFFLIFLVFGLSFLGLFELTLPNSWVTKADTQADKGGYYGIFFMALTLVLVSFSCTGPIVGWLLIQAAGGEILKPIVGMLSFSTALSLPFILFAIFPTWLQNLPRGGWFGVLKVSLGFLELAIALKFLSTADQVYHWGILDREVFLALWIVLSGVLGLYLLGKLQLVNEPKTEGIGAMRLTFAILVLSFMTYLIPGLFGAPLPPLAGLLPPITTMEGEDLYTQNNFSNNNNNNLSTEKRKHADRLKLPHKIEGFFDYKEGLEYAKKVNKPIFIDFTGHGCVNCREMEARVWSKPEVLKRLKNDYVVIALYVDDRHELPKNEHYVSKYDKQVKKTIGEQNADFQIVKFNNNAQPYYCLLDHEGELLVTPQAYNTDIQNFINFLDEGKTNFGKKKGN